jgi:far upstream element-binding protein
LQNLSGAQIDVPAECEPGTSVRHIQIRGDDQALVYVAELIRQKADPARSEEPMALPGDGRIVTKVVGVPDQHVGRIIGRQGETVRQLQDLTLCYVDVSGSATPGTDTRPITLTGTPANLLKAEELIRIKVG